MQSIYLNSHGTYPALIIKRDKNKYYSYRYVEGTLYHNQIGADINFDGVYVFRMNISFEKCGNYARDVIDSMRKQRPPILDPSIFVAEFLRKLFYKDDEVLKSVLAKRLDNRFQATSNIINGIVV